MTDIGKTLLEKRIKDLENDLSTMAKKQSQILNQQTSTIAGTLWAEFYKIDSDGNVEQVNYVPIIAWEHDTLTPLVGITKKSGSYYVTSLETQELYGDFQNYASEHNLKSTIQYIKLFNLIDPESMNKRKVVVY